MADKTLNNNTAYTLIRSAYEQMLGEHAIDTQDLSDFTQNGAAYDSLTSDNAWKDQFTKALLAGCFRNFYMDDSYRDEYKDPFYVSTEKWGAIQQMISAEAPAVQESHAWQTFTSGSSKVGEYTLYLPEVSAAFVGKSTSWELPIAITDEQWNTAFKNESELEQFVGFLMMVTDNAIVCHLQDCDNLNRNNFIAEKLAYASSVSATGVHVIDLVSLYRAETGDQTITTVEGFMSDDKCMRFAAETIDKYSGYLSKMSTLFNIDGKKKFVPKSRMVCQVLQHFYSRMKSVSYADAYNMDFVKLPNFDAVPYWQGFGADASGVVDFDEVSAIKAKTASGETVSQTGIVAFLCDNRCIMHCIQSQRTASTRHDPEALTQFYHQFKDIRWCNLQQNAVVFVLNDVATQNSKKK